MGPGVAHLASYHQIKSCTTKNDTTEIKQAQPSGRPGSMGHHSNKLTIYFSSVRPLLFNLEALNIHLSQSLSPSLCAGPKHDHINICIRLQQQLLFLAAGGRKHRPGSKAGAILRCLPSMTVRLIVLVLYSVGVQSDSDSSSVSNKLSGQSSVKSNRPSLAKILLSLDGNLAKQQALSHVLSALQIMYAR